MNSYSKLKVSERLQVGELERGAMLGGADGLAGVLGVGDFSGLGFDTTMTQGDGSFPRERAGDAGSDVGVDGFEEQLAGLVILCGGQLTFKSTGDDRTALALFERE